MDIPGLSLVFSHICLSLHHFIVQTTFLYRPGEMNAVSLIHHRCSFLQRHYSCPKEGLYLALLQSHALFLGCWSLLLGSSEPRRNQVQAHSMAVGWYYHQKQHGMRERGFPKDRFLDIPNIICPTKIPIFKKWLFTMYKIKN